MGVFDKLKNVFFEDEEIEVEEQPIKKEKAPVAKKVELSEMPKVSKEKKEREKEIENEVIEKVEKKGLSDRELRRSETFKFPLSFDNDDFDEEPKVKEEPKIIEEKPRPVYGGYKEEKIKSSVQTYTPAGLYEGTEYRKEQKVFKPTPIISPIYGVLDKNYRKEEIVQKKDIKLSSENARKVNLDTVREKAYGDLSNDILIQAAENNADKSLENDLYDLNDTDSPAINKVTVGDAEEYYNDLGLEYNIDYKDNSKEKATGRRTKVDTAQEQQEDDNLFDLIDSMYSDKE